MKYPADSPNTPPTPPRADGEIAVAAARAIECITTIPLEAIGISVQAGWVTLAGTVSSGNEKDTVAQIVGQVDGVHGVANLITVEAKDPTRLPSTG